MIIFMTHSFLVVVGEPASSSKGRSAQLAQHAAPQKVIRSRKSRGNDQPCGGLPQKQARSARIMQAGGANWAE
jgi:hypothetical protein